MRALDLTNQVFGELTAIKPITKDKKRGWECSCSCGKTKWVPTFQLTSGNTKTCGDGLHKQSIKVGDRFGKLTVASVYRDTKNRRYMAECLCDCGGIKPNASFRNLQRGATTHCGCSPNHINKGKPEGQSVLTALIRSYRDNAKRKGLPFTLTPSECESLFQGHCYFCGQPPSSAYTKKGLKGAYTYSSIDRINSAGGYTTANTMSCCTDCNYLKGNKTNEAFLAHILRIAYHQGTGVVVAPTT
jgi:hypothetical protein